MSALKDLLPLSGTLLLLVALSGLAAAAASLREDLAQLANTDTGERFTEDDVGYDNHKDIFYYKDDSVDNEYRRANYLSTKVTLGGQAPEFTGRAVRAAVNPFGVAQRTYKPVQVLMDRWDVKDDGTNVQYFALYHGRGGTYVVNKVRAHLLRMLANAVNDFVPQLDRIGEESDGSEDTDEAANTVMDNIRGTIEAVFREVDKDVRGRMSDSDDSSSTATIAIVTNNYVITVALGDGKVIAYNDDSETVTLTPSSEQIEPQNLFGLKGSRQLEVRPYVDFKSRAENNFKFLLLETPSVAAKLPDEKASRIIMSEISKMRNDKEAEQDIYLKSLLEIVNFIENNYSAFERIIKHSDYSVALVGLDTNYENIH